ncbi:MAG TPA: HNH endonuclease [Kofleriaceae bacterium]
MIRILGLIPAGGNYVQVQSRIAALAIDVSHFTGRGKQRRPRPPRALSEILVADQFTNSHKLRLRLFREGLKEVACELCGWAERAPDGRIPLELDHINGDKRDNRLVNLRVVCPNCHALQPTHRGLNRGSRRIRTDT